MKDDTNSIAVKYGPDKLRQIFDSTPNEFSQTTTVPLQQPGTPVDEIAPFETFDASKWEGQPIEPRRWIVRHRIPAGEPGIMSGDGGTGKTKLALQLCVAVAAELQDWVRGTIETHGPVIFYSAEEKLKEMQRRVADIIEHRGLAFQDLSRLHFICDEQDVTLGKVEKDGIVRPTLSLMRLEKTVSAIRPALVVIENAADVFSGNEIDRPNVTRFVRGMLGGLCKPSDAAMKLIQHPSVSGLQDGTGRSGSTAWNNSGRWRLNFTTLKPQDDDADDGLRQLHVIKSNYGPIGEKVRLKWERGVFVPEGTASGPERAAAEAATDTAFLRCLRVKTGQGFPVSPHAGKSYAPAIFEAMPEAEGRKAKVLAHAMERLLSAKRVRIEQVGSPSKRRDVVTECLR